MVNFGPLAAEIGPIVWGTNTNFNGFRVLAALLHHSTLFSQVVKYQSSLCSVCSAHAASVLQLLKSGTLCLQLSQALTLFVVT